MSTMSALVEELVDKYDLTVARAAETGIAGVRLYYHDEPISRGPLLYSSGIILLLRGRKMAYLGGRRFSYDPENYLALGLPLAVECETEASMTEPLFAIFLEVDPVFLRDVAMAMQLDLAAPGSREPAIAAAPLDGEMRDAVARLMRNLLSESETAILGEGTRREIIYRALQGPAGGALRGLLNSDSQTARIAEVMSALHRRFAERLSVDDMARMAGMSPSAFYRAFRDATDDTPLQYLKKVRLTHASTLIVHGGARVGAAAVAVGYESPAQFSRDFKSHFGMSPAEAKRYGSAFVAAGPGQARAEVS